MSKCPFCDEEVCNNVQIFGGEAFHQDCFQQMNEELDRAFPPVIIIDLHEPVEVTL
jgi:hypothetical protein